MLANLHKLLYLITCLFLLSFSRSHRYFLRYSNSCGTTRSTHDVFLFVNTNISVYVNMYIVLLIVDEC